jgi:hypothetical protein
MFGRFFRPSRLAVAGLALFGGLSGLALVGTAGTASASTASTGEWTTITAVSSGLSLDVTSSGVVVQNPLEDPGYAGPIASQIWHVPTPGTMGRIKNYAYNECLTTDGVQGDQLYLKRCTSGLVRYQTWEPTLTTSGYAITAWYTPYQIDVYGNSYQAGAPIDAWPFNGGYNNQFFQLNV